MQKNPAASQNKVPLKISGNPGRLLLVIAATIFASELFIMIFLFYMPSMSSYQEALFDSALLTMVVFPVLYFGVFKPMTGYIFISRLREKEKEQLIIGLKNALDEIKTLQEILPICSFCKKVRNDKGYWEQVDVYLQKHSIANISHGICSECLKKHYPEEYEAMYSTEKET